MLRKISQATAIKRGLKRFFTGKPCKRRHVAERYVCNKQCVKCALMAVEKYAATPKGQKKIREWQTSESGRESNRRCNSMPKAVEGRRVYAQSPLGREAIRRYYSSPKGKATNRRADQAHRDRGAKNGYVRRNRDKRNAYERDLRIRHHLDPNHPTFNPGMADFLIAKGRKRL